ncbi:MAG: hypothetical protein NZ602_12635 [Thermoguttaceae bacterium]|nr:hypothetical protein [Thermoguttaceae bacterium]MDW8036681.1 hypothetical protein [Thermoguttaceae bacterium]
MRQKNWTLWLMVAVGLAGCKAGGLTSNWANPLGFLMPKKSSEPEKPSSLASPTPPKAGYSSADDRSVAQSKPGSTRASQSGVPSAPSGSTSDFNASAASSAASGPTRYGGNMAFGTSRENNPSFGEVNTPYGTNPWGSSASSGSDRSRYGISPQIGRYDPGPAYADTPTLSASRSNAAGYTGYTAREYTSPSPSAERYGGSYSGASSTAPNWRSWESISGTGSSSPSDSLTRPDGYEKTSSWAGRTEYPGPSNRSGSYAAWDDRPTASSPVSAWGRSNEATPSSSGPSKVGYGTPGAATPEASSSGGFGAGSNNPYFSDTSRASGQNAPADSRKTSPNTADPWPTGGTRSQTGGTSLGNSDSSGGIPSASKASLSGDTGYKPGDTTYQPGQTGYQPGNTGYQPGETGYRPGQTGYNPPNTPPYQMPGASSGSSSSSGEYRPGSTRSYIPGKPL